MQSHYIIVSIWRVANLLASSPGAKWHCVFPPLGFIFMFALCTQADKRSLWSFFSLLRLDFDLTALEKATWLHRAAIDHNHVLLSFDIKRVKGHKIRSLPSPNISVLLSPLQIFLYWPFFLGSGLQHLFFVCFFLSVVPIPLFFSLHTRTRTHADTHAHSCTHTEENLYVSDIQQGKDKGTELITHHLLLLRRTDGSRRYVNGKGQWIIRFF